MANVMTEGGATLVADVVLGTSEAPDELAKVYLVSKSILLTRLYVVGRVAWCDVCEKWKRLDDMADVDIETDVCMDCFEEWADDDGTTTP